MILSVVKSKPGPKIQKSVRKILNFFFNTEIYIPLAVLIQNIYCVRGLYPTVLEPFANKQTEPAIIIPFEV